MATFLTLVLDGVGIGEQPDAGLYNDEGSHTLGHVCAVAHPHLPNLEQLGLGCIEPLAGVGAAPYPAASFGKMREVSAGKDSTTGHWELAGIKLMTPFPTFPDGFPDDLIDAFLKHSGCDGVLANCAGSGTDMITTFGQAHEQSGWPIVYTSADSVFQIAAHKDTIPLDTLYKMSKIARDNVCVGAYSVGRVIARPFVGQAGAYQRVSAERKDYSLAPPAKPLQVMLQEKGVRTLSVGKIADLFDDVGFDERYKTKSNEEGIAQTIAAMRAVEPGEDAFIWVNLVDFDQEYGHRNNPHGFARALEVLDASLPVVCDNLRNGDVLVLTADHGNDPTTPGTDHSREYVPVLKYIKGQEQGRPLGVRKTFADHAATVAAFFNAPFECEGEAF